MPGDPFTCRAPQRLTFFPCEIGFWAKISTNVRSCFYFGEDEDVVEGIKGKNVDFIMPSNANISIFDVISDFFEMFRCHVLSNLTNSEVFCFLLLCTSKEIQNIYDYRYTEKVYARP